MEWIAIITGLALIEYLVFSIRVGFAREKYGVVAPATTGDETFERFYRVQQNTVEQLVVFLPALWMFGTFMSAKVGAAIGMVFVVGRAIYAVAYVAEPKKRTVGFVMGYLTNVVLILGSLGGAIRSAL